MIVIFFGRGPYYTKTTPKQKKTSRRKHNVTSLYKLAKKFLKCICLLKQKHNLHCQYDISSVGNTCFQTIEKGKRKQFSASLPDLIERLKINTLSLRVCRVAKNSAKNYSVNSIRTLPSHSDIYSKSMNSEENSYVKIVFHSISKNT